MKKILSILGGLTMAYSPIMVSSHLISSYINTNKSNPVENSINEIENTIKNSSDIKEYIIVYSKVPNTIFYASSREQLDEYMTHVYKMANKMYILNKNNAQQKTIFSISQEIQRKYNEWVEDQNIDDLGNNYSDTYNQLISNSRKMYYAFNEAVSNYIIDDMNTYQPLRIEQSKLQAEVISLSKEISYNNDLLEKIERMQTWQKNLTTIYDNWINKAKSLKKAFDDSILSFGNAKNPEEISKFIHDSAKIYFSDIISKVFKENSESEKEDIKNKIKSRIESRKVDIDKPKIPEWFERKESDVPSESTNYNYQYSESEIQNLMIEQINKKIKEVKSVGLNLEEETNKKIDIVSDVCEQVFAIDDLLFGTMHNAANEFIDFINNGIGTLSNDLKNSLQSEGVVVPNELDEAVSESMDIVKAIGRNVIAAFAGENISKLSSIAFSSLDEINKWFKDFMVMGEADNAINAIENTEKEVTKIPDNCNIDPDKVKKENYEKQAKLNWDQERLKAIEQELEKSKYDFYQDYSKNWKNKFEKYKKFLKIDEEKYFLNLNFQFNGGSFSLDLIKYFKNTYNDYEELMARENMLYNKIILTGKAKDYFKDKYEQFVNDHETFIEIKEIVDEGNGEIK